MNYSNSTSSSCVTVTLEIARERQGTFLQFAREFCGSTLRIAPCVHLGNKPYRETADELLAEGSTSSALARRIAEDDCRDPLDALRDAQALHALHVRRLAELLPR